MTRRAPTALFVLGGLGAAGLLLIAAGGSTVTQPLVTAVQGAAGRFFSWAELTASTTAQRLGLANTPPPAAAANLQRLVTDLLDPLRARLGRPIRVTSGFRSDAVNEAVHGSPTSQHRSGEAVDFKVPGAASRDVAAFIARSGLPFDQVIWYDPERGGHVHLSYTTTRPNRREVLYAPASGGYRPWPVSA
ncbi:MAG: D-Ala-D-Ala carboxypeptidase family metallohydrolase [Pseudomonadota bacterium]